MKKPPNIYGLALNYKGMAKYFDAPIFFIKGADSISIGGGKIQFPIDVKKLWTECELGVVIGKNCKDVSEMDTYNKIKGFVVCGDITCENIVNRDHHLAFSKSRNKFCPTSSEIVQIKESDLCNLQLKTVINNKIVQKGNTSDMIYSPLKSISYISSFVNLVEDDLIVTGTPPFLEQNFPTSITVGDKIVHSISGFDDLHYEII